MDAVSPQTDAHKSGLLGKKLPPKCQESVMPKLIFGVVLREAVSAAQVDSKTFAAR
jgi:hypothetical protein